ncbi:MAG TPA: PA14 domain-containing protein, partial [Anaerolineae bacterium]|nr:PA14 domain-containing protein [Anaerolineae bacterium]
NFTGQPFGIWYDEAEAGLQARQMVQEASYRPVFYAPINVTGHLLALYALALDWLGDSIYSLRLVSVLFGLGGVFAAYLLGQEMRGPRFGLLLAFLVAVARWHVNFSRIAMTGVDAPFFEFLSLFFLVRLLRRGHLRDALWAGLSLGFGLLFYTAFRLYLAALPLFVIAACLLGMTNSNWQNWWAVTLHPKNWSAYLGRLALIAVSIGLVIMPIIRFALSDAQSFWYRTNQISIFTRRDQPDIIRAVWDSTSKHLLMFNYIGDGNGRHNLPGEPMLDPVMAILGVLGLGLALSRPRHPANLFFLILFPVALAGGILSVDFEAPQSLRSIAAIPAVIYFIGLALAALGREAQESFKTLPRLWLAIPTAALLGAILGFNAYTYFIRQANDFASWNAFSAPETIAGRKMAQLGPNTIYYLSPFLAYHPTVRFLAPDVTDQRSLTLLDPLPIRVVPNRPVALLIHPDDIWVFEEARRIYPGANFEVAHSQTEDVNPIVYLVELQPLDLAAVQGLQLQYQQLDSQANSPPADTERALTISANWPDDIPRTITSRAKRGADPYNFVAEWSGILYAPRYGPYSLRLITPGPGLLELDGNVIFEGQGNQLTGLPLAQGNHLIRVRAEGGPGQVALYWQAPGRRETLIPQWALYSPPIANHGLLGTYYPNDRWEGQPALQRIDPFLDVYFHFTPLPRPYTVEWAGSLDAPLSGLYHFGLRAVQAAQLYVDGNLLLTTIAPDEIVDNTVTLEAGLHEIKVRYKDNTDRSRIHLYWMPPTGQFKPIPSQNLWPPLGRYPARATPPVAETKILPLTLNWQATLGGPGNQPGQFLEPRDVAVLNNGNLVVADTVNRRVQLLDPQGRPLQILTGDDLPFEEPLAVAVNNQDEILILDSTLQWIYRYDSAGNYLDRFGGPMNFLFHPRGLTVFEDNSLALADTGSSRLALFSTDGVPTGSIGGLGSGPGQFNEPTDVLRDAQGTYYVVEAENNRLQRVDAAGNPLLQWTIPNAYGLNGPHLAFGPDGSIFMTESQSRSLYRYAPDGSLLDQWQTVGPVNLAAPVGIYFDAQTNRLYITDVLT